jgi:hypothetical protein
LLALYPPAIEPLKVCPKVVHLGCRELKTYFIGFQLDLGQTMKDG